MVGKKVKDPNLQRVTLRLDGPTYRSIQRFAALTAGAYNTSELIRLILERFGQYCALKMEESLITDIDVTDIDKLILSAVKEPVE